MGESKRKEEYLCFPEHLCTCYSFLYDIVGRGEQLCVSSLSAATASNPSCICANHGKI
jgi:predicted nucleic acid-binding Zn finger protein